ncbi:MAG: Gfo/Idh/MocA family oxidoreductase [Capsulimonadales bacterium]|nr:Gfo/Idh/MocA family oxidoreductase [Capsulimonadales bacterium]
MSEPAKDDYALKADAPVRTVAAPELPYRPRDPEGYRPKIGMIGCGGITQHHLTAYRNAGYDVVAFYDLRREQAEKRRDAFYPDATVYDSPEDLLARDDIEVVDIATHPAPRVALIEAALDARKHVLSQKPFVVDLDTGARLADRADAQGVRLAVNQNGRWSPHHAYLREAVRRGILGDLVAAHIAIHWDHTWVRGTPFEEIREVILYDFSIHWFDFLCTLLGDRPMTRVFATRSHAAGQTIRPPMLAQCLVSFEGGQASLVFDAHVPFGAQDATYLGGTRGTLTSVGPNLGEQTVTLVTAEGVATPSLEGTWFPDGFHGTMAELLCAIAEGREPQNSARNNLKSLGLCFAAIASATDGTPKTPGSVRRLPPGSAPGVE